MIQLVKKTAKCNICHGSGIIVRMSEFPTFEKSVGIDLHSCNQRASSLFFLMCPQKAATKYIQDLLNSRRLLITPRTMTFENKDWIVFEYKDRELKIDPLSGLWIRMKDDEWKCLATPCNVSGALQAVEFLCN